MRHKNLARHAQRSYLIVFGSSKSEPRRRPESLYEKYGKRGGYNR
ncbi:hypothetical protein [Natrinema sp. CBA1119]|nr:hypothetical protein [Natrinema sp. CBA1119]